MFSRDFDRDEYTKKFAAKLRVLRSGAEMTQEEIAHAVGITRQTYYSYENSTRPVPWDKCLALLFFFEHNEVTSVLLSAFKLMPFAE